MISRIFAALAAGCLLAAASGQASTAAPLAAWSLPSDAGIREILADRIDARRQGVGIVVGVIDADGKRRIVAYGARNQGDSAPLDGDTVFEIGSMTKVFTSLLLSDMTQHGEVALDDPVAKYLPAGVSLPERGGRQITLVDLATHTSGLPRLQTNLSPADPANPYADYSVEQLYQFLGSYKLPRDIGAQYEYSNVGSGLLGHALSRRAGVDYAVLVRRRITLPLGMASTVVSLSPELRARLAVGHDLARRPVENWDIPTLAGAGALRSTANDMLVFLAAELGEVETPLTVAMRAQLSPRRPTGRQGLEVALGWHVRSDPEGEIVWHDGGTGGYCSFMAFNPQAHVGVVVLSNTASDVDDIGMHILAGRPLTPPPVEHHAVVLDAARLDAFVGRYQLTPKVFIAITRNGEQLFAHVTGQPADEILPEGPRDVFWKAYDAQATLQVGPDGRVSGLVLHMYGADTPAVRVP